MLPEARKPNSQLAFPKLQSVHCGPELEDKYDGSRFSAPSAFLGTNPRNDREIQLDQRFGRFSAS
jgi:hypothetical protein